ncbi:helix-turn-helix domain-containing protein [Ancylobacter sp. VNQ12]|uniref:helix-turn-helix domain-containing protein n=1 Tax=Ancylobacter sp. VNQ12 TaxID=3400920 RepID=UPI003C105D43
MNTITAEHIRAARTAANESQAAFGARFGVDQSTVHRWETDGPPIRPMVQTAIAAVVRPILEGPTVSPAAPAPQEAAPCA